jgi:hypothetical protein
VRGRGVEVPQALFYGVTRRLMSSFTDILRIFGGKNEHKEKALGIWAKIPRAYNIPGDFIDTLFMWVDGCYA